MKNERDLYFPSIVCAMLPTASGEYDFEGSEKLMGASGSARQPGSISPSQSSSSPLHTSPIGQGSTGGGVPVSEPVPHPASPGASEVEPARGHSFVSTKCPVTRTHSVLKTR